MRMYDIISKKRDGGELSEEEIRFFVSGCVSGAIPDYQSAALLMAICIRSMTKAETVALTLAMAHSGDTVDLSAISGMKADKHSTGGVGDKTTLVAAPIAAAAGVKIAKMSGRGLGHTGGTIDKLESIPGFRTELSREKFFSIVDKTGLCVVGQSGNLVPADKKLYALRDVTATVESIPLIASSIMSKKLAAGADAIVLDVKTGSGAFMKKREDAEALAKAMVEIGKGAGKRICALLTDMNRPLGRKIGNALEVEEAFDTLCGKGPADLTELSLALSSRMIFLADCAPDLEAARKKAESLLSCGKAKEKFLQMVAAQGGDPSVLTKLPRAGLKKSMAAPRDGFLFSVDTLLCGEACVLLGAGREKKGDPVDSGAGIVLLKTVGDAVSEGETVAELYASDAEKLSAGAALFRKSLSFSEKRPPEEKLIEQVII